MASRRAGHPSGSTPKIVLASCAMITSEMAAIVTRTPLKASGSSTLVPYFTTYS